MKIVIITKNKKDFLDLLLLADQEYMIDKYLDRGSYSWLYRDTQRGRLPSS